MQPGQRIGYYYGDDYHKGTVVAVIPDRDAVVVEFDEWTDSTNPQDIEDLIVCQVEDLTIL